MAAALDPDATALATDGICPLRSPAAESPGALVWKAGSSSRASTTHGTRVGGDGAELLGERRALVQGHRHEQPATRAFPAVGKADGCQGATGATQLGDAALVDHHPRRAQPLCILGLQFGGPVGEQGHVVAPDAQEDCALYTRGAPVEHSERLVADLPAVTERAVEHRASPPLGDAGQVGPAVVHPGGEQHTPRTLARAGGELEHEAPVAALAAHDLTRMQLDGGIARQLVAPGGVERGRWPAIVAEQPADAVGDAVALASGVDHERPLPRAAEHQRSAQAGGTGTDDDAIPLRFHAETVTRLDRSANLVCHGGKRDTRGVH